MIKKAMSKLDISRNKPKIVLFDWDDTLVDTGQMYKKIFHEVIEELQIDDWDREAAEKYKFYSRRECLPLIFGDKWSLVNEAYIKKIKEIKLEHVLPFNDALNTIKILSEDGIYMSIVSNKDAHHLNEEVKFLGWYNHFHRVIGSNDAPRDKPWPDPVHLALQGLEVKKNDTIWFVGDSLVDIQCAKDTGCVPILFGNKDPNIHSKINYLRIDYFHAHDHIDLLRRYKESL